MTEDQLASIYQYLQTNPSAEDLAAAQAQFGVSNADLAAAQQYGSGGSEAAAPSGPVLTPEQRDFITWQGQQINPATGRPLADTWASQGISNPMADPRIINQAQEQIDRAGRREDLYAQAGVTPGDFRPWSDAPPPGRTVVGGGAGGGSRPTSTAGGGGAGPGGGGSGPGGGGGGGLGPGGPVSGATSPRLQAIQQWYNANLGRTDQQAQGDLNRWLATSGFTAREINAALPQWGLNDLQNAMRTAIGEVAQQTPFAPAAAQPLQPLAQPYTSIASQLPGGADARAQEIRNWYAANEGRGTQADLDRFLASGYSAQEINKALPQFGVNDLERQIGAARQTYPEAAFQRQLSQYQTMAPGAQFTGAASPYGLLSQQAQPFVNPYADALANIALGGYRPDIYNLLLDETVDPITGQVVPDGGGGEGPGGGGDDGPGVGDSGPGGSSGEAGAAAGGAGPGGPGGGDSGDGYAMGGLVSDVFGNDPAGPDEGQINIQRGEYVIKKSSVNKYGKGLLDMINDGKISAKKIKSLLD